MKDKLGQEIRVGDTICKAGAHGSSSYIDVGIVTSVTETTCNATKVSTLSRGIDRVDSRGVLVCRRSTLVINLGYCLDYDQKKNEVIGEVFVK